MDKKTIAIIGLCILLLISITINIMHSNKYSKLEKRFESLKEIENAECKLINAQAELIVLYEPSIKFEALDCEQDW